MVEALQAVMKLESTGVTGVRERRSGWLPGMTQILSTVVLKFAPSFLELQLQARGYEATEGGNVPEDENQIKTKENAQDRLV